MNEALHKLRKPFPAEEIGKLPKPTRAQTEEVKANFKAGARCSLCNSWHHPAVVHLDYVGHAAVTNRLLDADPEWTWEPLAYTDDGLPRFDDAGGLWGKLTVCGVTRIGYGNADKKPNSDAGVREKEVISDFLRNAAMRFGVGLELWHKGELHVPDESPTRALTPPPNSVLLNIEKSAAPALDSLEAARQRGLDKIAAAANASAEPAPPRLTAIVKSADGSVHSEHLTMGGWMSAFEALTAAADSATASVLIGQNLDVIRRIESIGIFKDRMARIKAGPGDAEGGV